MSSEEVHKKIKKKKQKKKGRENIKCQREENVRYFQMIKSVWISWQRKIVGADSCIVTNNYQ